MIEQNAVAGVDVVGFSVVDNDPVGVKFCDTCNKDQVDSIKQVLTVGRARVSEHDSL